ncbi:CAMK family protein kinase [Trichomonas vaginalis G3]|uniref:non-specific serine/threonine protein kinase n=1 Tax=Trichomonas vaginalis (strain ATCC PRA-98 / G3) TaxID=412133 RepID=A2DMN5_TRIV3|nr:protein serine/threonine kinase protein [Trichomonas vaginalis G3]EAY18256.1 CAMK family protein kinase [Trichomonas vaginalis G3]KAI5541923.1 protein serine/threonine kinase protein [Trichomonas vaginalis G3]|eukprot:XP_001579242.1 CAMK family protein kinase [Trichomonas vaginalis G3]
MSQDPMSRYKRIQQIGKGSYGKVYLMKDNKNGDYVVVKTIKIKGSDDSSRKTAQKEATLLSNLRHPNIIAYIDSFYTPQGDFSIVLEYADGKDLQKYLESHEEIKEKKVLQIFTQIILGLEYIHSQNILHRDIKTANVFLFKRGLVKLGDFGISREVTEDSFAQTMIGTPYFMCPELLRGDPYSFPADIWAAGCVLFELLTHKHAFTGKSREELFTNIKSGNMSMMPSGYSKELIELLMSMLQQDPNDRPTCKEILASNIIGHGLNELQTELSKKCNSNPSSGRKSQIPPPSKNAPSSSRSSSRQNMSSQSKLDTTDDDEIDQKEMPAWLNRNDQNLCNDLVRQSQRHLEKDSSWLLGVIRSSISTKAIPKQTVCDLGKLTGKIDERRNALVSAAKSALGSNYEYAYKWIKEYGQDRRKELMEKMPPGTDYEKEFRMLEVITAIEELA